LNDGGRLPAGLSMLSDDSSVNAAAHIEASGQAHEAWLGSGNQIIQDAVGDSLVEGAFITV
jgi:hypothetical protein